MNESKYNKNSRCPKCNGKLFGYPLSGDYYLRCCGCGELCWKKDEVNAELSPLPTPETDHE